VRIKELIKRWQHAGDGEQVALEYRVNLPLPDAARLAALEDMFPGTNQNQLITDLVSAALRDLEEAMPYVPGQKVVAEDELGDPIHEDVGHTPTFHALTRKHLQRLRADRPPPAGNAVD